MTAQELYEKYCKAKDLVEQNHWHIHCAESPLRHAEYFIRTLPELKRGYKRLEAFLFSPLFSNSTATAATAKEPNYQRSEE